jgi:hypothetical protein
MRIFVLCHRIRPVRNLSVIKGSHVPGRGLAASVIFLYIYWLYNCDSCALPSTHVGPPLGDHERSAWGKIPAVCPLLLCFAIIKI